MQFSPLNPLTAESIKLGEGNAEIVVAIESSQELTSICTVAERLEVGRSASALIKSSAVLVGVD